MATVTKRLGLADHGSRMSLEEFEEAEVEEGFRYELAKGVLEVSEVPNDPHGFVVWNLLTAIVLYSRQRARVVLRAGGASEFQLRLPGMSSGRHPDVSVVLTGTPPDRRGRRPPTFVVEVVSPGSEARHRDYVTKREEYLRFGCREYWIVDPEARRVTVLIRDGDTWTETVFVDGQVAAGLALPGFAVPVADLWVLPDEAEGEAD